MALHWHCQLLISPASACDEEVACWDRFRMRNWFCPESQYSQKNVFSTENTEGGFVFPSNVRKKLCSWHISSSPLIPFCTTQFSYSTKRYCAPCRRRAGRQGPYLNCKRENCCILPLRLTQTTRPIWYGRYIVPTREMGRRHASAIRFGQHQMGLHTLWSWSTHLSWK
jgi:hypothetical protein